MKCQDHGEQPDRPFNPWRVYSANTTTPATPPPPLTAHVLTILEKQRTQGAQRPRRRHPQDQQRYEQTVGALVADLAYNHLANEPGRLHLSRSNRVLSRKYQRRYKPEFLHGKMLPAILDSLEQSGLVIQVKGKRGAQSKFAVSRYQTVISAGPHLVELLNTYRVTLDHISANYEGQELVVLKSERADDFKEADLEDYEDDPHTVRYRQEVRAINAWLRGVPITTRAFLGFPLPLVDLRERNLRRYFTRSSFTSGGRLFGAFWQQMGKADRLRGLLIDGQEVVETDYSAAVPRLLYGVAGMAIPTALQDDPYRIPGFEQSRPGIKKLFNALLFDPPQTKRRNFPRQSKERFDRGELARVGGVVGPVIDAIKQAHYPVADRFGTGVGHRLMFLESQTLIAVLLELLQRNAPALPIHDAVLTSQRNARMAERVMLETFEKIAGIEGKVSSTTYRDL